MPVTLNCNQLFQNHRDLYQFLLFCQQRSCEQNHPQIVSVSFKTHSIDPLSVFNKLAQSNQLNFYLEKHDLSTKGRSKQQKFAIAALDSAAQIQLQGSTRFTQVKSFIQNTLNHTILAGDLDCEYSGPTFFCGFSFGETTDSKRISVFPAATVFLPKWQISCDGLYGSIVANFTIAPDSNPLDLADDLWQTFAAIRQIQYEFLTPTLQHLELLKKQDIVPTSCFKASVASALKSIDAGFFHKVVLAHAVDVVSPIPFRQGDSLNNLRQLYPDCYVFSLSNGKGQNFIGASPERLVCVKDRQLVTDALAGSAPRGQTPLADRTLANTLLSSQKEIHEHQVVVDFITQHLLHLGLKPQSFPLRLLQLSNIQHLHTPIQATVPESVHLLDIVAELHPTPAVAGLPREIACEVIRQSEAFERSLYAAPIGWVNYKGDGEFVVGIRSALIDGCRARLFGGAGIVAGSDPEKELSEVQLKLQALLAALV